MKIVFVGLVLNLLWTFGLSQDFYGFNNAQAVEVGTYLCIGFWSLSVVGFLMMLSGKRKAGSVLVIIGSVIFVPLGLVAIIGARKATSKDRDASLEGRELSGRGVAAFHAVKQGNLMFVCGIVVLLVYMLAGFSSPASLGAIGVIMMVMGVWWRQSPLVEFRDDHLMINRGPVRSKLELRYSEISQVEYKKRSCILHYRRHGNEAGKVRKIGIASGGLLPHDRDRFELAMRNRVDSGKQSQEVLEG
ncbi:hypothetical protein [Halomonas huangheensis]|uniref:Uncharacterized protein n=1 Tax=Halomonas huangheensis TaxID=1178482 RepID=W1N918_9GAMM|nr:hypothetical protein [Halomonas huangheensis]ALM53973.1 hypothetical protein AR456_18120 [Halomonas huangheensis]ERL52067.1 hypothetical protein BJB45_08880 [Halomonas huangheensis]